MILFLDDCPHRIPIFLRFFPHAVVTSSAKTMIRLLTNLNQPIEYLFLDHDLQGDANFVEGVVEDTGMEVVQWLENNRPNIKQVVVHSHNGIASPQMHERLVKANYWTVACPFYMMIPQFEARK